MNPRPYQDKIMTREAMKAECDRLRGEGRTVAFTNGCFDILHAGHASYLAFARAQGDALIVGVNSDASLRRYKGDTRPLVPQEDRALMLAALEVVDYVVIFEEDEPLDLLRAFRPEVLVKGADRADYVAGREIVEGYGGRVMLAPVREGRSTSSIIRRVLDAYGEGSGG